MVNRLHLLTSCTVGLLVVTSTIEAFAPSAATFPADAVTSPPEGEWANLLSNFNTAPNERRTKTIRKKRKIKKAAQKPQSVLSSPSFRKKGQRAPTSVLLTAEEELDYAYKIRAYKAALNLRDELVRSLDGVFVHPTDEEWAAACGTTISNLHRVTDEGRQARSALVAANTGLVVQQANRHHLSLKRATEAGGGLGTILSVADMIQEGHLGLMEAAERFDPDKGFRFSTYATYWVRQRILKSISDTSRVIRLPVHVHDTLVRVRKAKEVLIRELGQEPTMAELAKYLDMSEERLTQYTASSRNVMSLERPVTTHSSKNDPDQQRRLLDTLVSDAPTPEESVGIASLRSDIQAVMESELDQSERDVLLHRFGFYDNAPKSVSETAVLLNITRDRARLLEARALNKLRHPKSHQKLRDYAPKDHEYRRTESFQEKITNNTPPRTDRLWFF